MKQYVNIIDFARENPNVPILLSAGDLMTFSQDMVSAIRTEFERQIQVKSQEDVYLLPDMVTSTYHISRSTLYRLAKAKILVPIWIGGQRRWRRRDVEEYIDKRR